jgi:hypothetical protein
MINYQDSIATMSKLCIMNEIVKIRIQSHIGGRGLLNDLEDDWIR